MKLTNNWEGRNYMKYQKENRFAQFKNKVKSFFKKVLFWSVVILALAGTVQYFRWAYPNYRTEIVQKEIKIDTLTPRIAELKAEILDSLRACESNGYTEDDGLIVYDSNKVASIGLFQFQKKTVIHYYKTLYGQDITGKRAIEIALDEKLSRKLAEDIIFKDSKGIDNWYNCKNKKGLGENIKWVNKLNQ
jgi:cell division protein FtsL